MGLKKAFEEIEKKDTNIEKKIKKYEKYIETCEQNEIDNKIIKRLEYIVKANELSFFYNISRIKEISSKIGKQGLMNLARKLRIDNEDDILKLIALSLYNIVLYINDSKTLHYYNKEDERKDDLYFIIDKIANIKTIFDDDGISLRFFNSKMKNDSLKTSAEIEIFLKEHKKIDGFLNSRMAEEQMEDKIIKPIINKLINNDNNKNPIKPFLIITITDCAHSNDEFGLDYIISNTKNDLKKNNLPENSVEFSFAQVGKDDSTKEILYILKNDTSIGDMIDITTYYEMEQVQFKKNGSLTPQLWLIKLLIGLIEPEKDHKDEISLSVPYNYRF